MAVTTFEGVDALLGAAGRDLGTTDWYQVEGWQLTLFAAVIDAPPTPDGSAPPMWVLALTNLFLPELLEVQGASNGVNYGTGPVRFGPAVHPGDRLRGRATLVEAVEVPHGVQTAIEIQVELEGRDEPACTVRSLSRWMR
jgi:acyl dehydratase